MIETRTAARTTDPSTSHAAARSVRGLTDKQDAVLTCFQHSAAGVGVTDAELRSLYDSLIHARALPQQSDSGLRTRRKELTSLGRIVDTGKRRAMPSGRSAIVWQLATDA